MSGAWGRRRVEAEKFLGRLQEMGPPSSLFLAGPEVLLRDEILEEMRRTVLGNDADGRWNREVYQARELPLADLAAGLRDVGLFAAARLVVVTEVERYGRSSAADRAEFWGWLERPSPGIHIILASEKPLWELERANEFLKGTLKVVDAVVPLEHPGFEKAVQMARKMARERYAMTIPEDAAQRLVDAVGPNLLEISNEIDRLGLRLGAGAEVDAGRSGELVAQRDRRQPRRSRGSHSRRRRGDGAAVLGEFEAEAQCAGHHLDARQPPSGRDGGEGEGDPPVRSGRSCPACCANAIVSRGE